ncbi:hypothetical protein ElyMa_002681700 [Elysia marginata]|uniref:Ornithine decarboxylase antizyme n=1 Tax=Elysia marginata TaxID=1093978 RepID=A0AAV4HBU0_9GAST|nr:hypothetical protein ElyMa_002681700 [Elysia marginata]
MQHDVIENPLSHKDVPVMRLEYTDLKLLFKTKDVARELFPSKRLFHFMVGYRLLDANIRYMLCKRSCVLISLKEKDGTCHSSGMSSTEGLCKTERNSGQLDFESIRRVSMMTNYLWYPTRGKGFSVILNISVRWELSHEDLIAHLRYLKKDMQSRFPGWNGVLSATYEPPLSSSQVMSCFRDIGFGEVVPNTERLVVLWERPKSKIWSKL